MKAFLRTLTLAGAVIASGPLAAAGGHVELMKARINLSDTASLQRGARTFVNYCTGCHSAQYMRYSRLGKDLEIPEEVVEDNLMFNADKIGSTIQVSMQPNDAVKWFGVVPPDLSVVARSRGADWLYSFLLSYYKDDSKPTGVNNTVFQGTAMPHVLAPLEGIKRKVEHHDEDGEGHGGGHGAPEYEMVTPGSMNAASYEDTVRDLVNYLVYMGEPAKLVRYKIGTFVLGFLVVLLVFTYALKREYWRDVH